MKLSVIIVNYNVKHFLEQCLCSVLKAAKDMDAEIVVIDNASFDNSVEYLKPRFPGVNFLSNKENLGFAKACNQGVGITKGDYILFLNPDTIVPEDCFKKCISFFESNPKAGAVGIKMLDGKGQFLKESKRAFPSPFTSLYKLFGLSKLFPNSPTFSRYHLGHLNENKNHAVDVLAGAFFLTKREILNKTGGFDETFFMYGEDVDLSYRIQQAGYLNYYFAGSSILHFKGESTRKGSMNYVRMFYNAMSIFVRKHYGSRRAGFFSFLIHIAIWLRAGLTALGNFIRRAGLPLIDAGLILLSFIVVKNIWSRYVRTDIDYPTQLLWIAFPAFTLFYLLTAYYAGLYDRWYKRTELVRSTLIATVALLAGYSLLPERYRFSRGIIFFGALLAFVLMSFLRRILINAGILNSSRQKKAVAGTLIVGSQSEFIKAKEILKEAGLEETILGRIAVNGEDHPAIGNYKQLDQIAGSIPFSSIIFCEGTFSFAEIISSLPRLPKNVSVKIYASGSNSMVGSDSKDTLGESVSKENGYNLSNPYNRRLKRLLDVSFAIGGLLTFPVHLFGVKKPFRFLNNCFQTLVAQKTWVGYATTANGLPPLRKAVIACNAVPMSASQQLPAESLQLLDYWYARDYEPVNDIKILWRMYRFLGE